MKKFLEKYLIGKMIKSKKFWYMISSIVVPAIVTLLGVDVETATQIFQALLVLILGQGIADIKK
tara:strand:- start:42 stop:233 length:192 start_codon:yes stop_codon:yes gene_type:complete